MMRGSNKMGDYQLIITERQAELIIQSLDLFTRLSLGQMDFINEHIWGIDGRANQYTLQMLQRELFPKLNGLHHSYGIHSPELDDRVREAYDIFKVMMYEFNKDKGAMNVYADKPRQASNKELPVFALSKEVEQDERVEQFKEKLAWVLDKEFPKGECQERGNALVLYAQAVILLERILEVEQDAKS